MKVLRFAPVTHAEAPEPGITTILTFDQSDTFDLFMRTFQLVVLLQAILLSPWEPELSRAQDLVEIDSLVATDTALRPIPIGSIATEAVRATAELWAIRENAEPSVAVNSAKINWEGRQRHLQNLKDETNRSLGEETDPDWLLDLERRWLRFEVEMEKMLDLLSGRAQSLSDDLLRLASMQEEWSLTRGAVRQIDLPPTVLSNMDSVLTQIAEIQPIVEQRLNAVLELESQLAVERQMVHRVFDRIEARATDELIGFIQRESTPVADILGFDLSRDPSVGSRPYLMLYLVSTGDYLSQNIARLWLHLGILLVLIWLTRTLHGRIREWNERHAGLPVDAEIFSRPYSAALLVALLATELVHPQASMFLIGIALIASITPAYRLLSIRIPEVFRFALRVFFGYLVVLLVARFLIPESILIGRLAYFLITVVGAVGLWWYLRPGGTSEILASSQTGRHVLTGLRLALIVLVLAAVSGLTGFGPLSRHLLTSTVYATYFLLLIYIGVLVVTAILLGLLKSPLAHRSNVIRNYFDTIATRLTKALKIVAVLVGIRSVLEVFAVNRVVMDWLGSVLTARIEIGAVELSLGGILVFLLTFWIALLVAKFIRFLLNEEVLTRVRMGRGKPQAISGTIYYILITLGFILALSATGMPMDRLTVLAGAFGVGLGFGLQDVVNNFVSGLILLYESPVQVGDTIEFGTRTGTVERIGIRSSIVRTFEGAEVSVPNSHLVSNEVTNWTMSDKKRRLSVLFGVAYGTDTSKVAEIALPVAVDHPEVDPDPEPVLLFKSMADSSLNFELRCWSSSPSWPVVHSDLTRSIYDALGEAGVSIPFPQRDLHLRSVDPRISLSGKFSNPDDSEDQ